MAVWISSRLLSYIAFYNYRERPLTAHKFNNFLCFWLLTVEYCISFTFPHPKTPGTEHVNHHKPFTAIFVFFLKNDVNLIVTWDFETPKNIHNWQTSSSWGQDESRKYKHSNARWWVFPPPIFEKNRGASQNGSQKILPKFSGWRNQNPPPKMNIEPENDGFRGVFETTT